MSGAKPRIILDTNVLYAGLYSSSGASHEILKSMDRGKVKIVVSPTLVFEYEDVLRRNRAVLGLSDREIDRLLDYFCLRGEHQTIHFLWRPTLPDPKDDHILELAVASGVGVIVTHNTRDFTGVAEFGVRAITPKEVLEEIL
jgi:putative PIN family toxin of toxin-antitoxin system